MATKSTAARPFLKWAGGKTQLLPAIAEILPRHIETYFEPFLGGGAVFFHMAAQERFKRAVLNDWNQDLIGCYRIIQEAPDEILRKLRDHMANEWNTDAYFKSIRLQKPADLDPVARAARMIYLNKTCFNGLFRVNKSGQFNVPFGKYKNPALFNEQNLRACSEVLRTRGATLFTGDFAAPEFGEAIAKAGPGDAIYFDPPYVPLSATSNFANYTADGFGLDDQHRLAAFFKILVDKGAFVVLSNSDTEVVRSLYAGYEMYPVQAKRAINAKADGRGAVGELLIVGRDAKSAPTEVPAVLLPIPVAVVVECVDCGETRPSDTLLCESCGSGRFVEMEP
jgi:DNA adenine methylase